MAQPVLAGVHDQHPVGRRLLPGVAPVELGRLLQPPVLWEGEPAGDGNPGEERVLTYKQLHREVCRFANVLKRNGIRKGDRVLIYLPMIPEAAIAMLACTRIGAVHSVVFGGFSAQSVADRIQDSQARLVITADGGFRRGAVVPLKLNVDEAMNSAGRYNIRGIPTILVFKGGQVVEQIVGAVPKDQITKAIDRHVS